MLEAIVSSFIVAITLLLGAYVILKRTVENAKYELIEEFSQWIATENGAKFLYSVGALIGNGAKSGFGLNPRGGKMKFEDIIAGIAAQWIGQKFQVPQASNTPENLPSQQQSPPINKQITNVKSKW